MKNLHSATQTLFLAMLSVLFGHSLSGGFEAIPFGLKAGMSKSEVEEHLSEKDNLVYKSESDSGTVTFNIEPNIILNDVQFDQCEINFYKEKIRDIAITSTVTFSGQSAYDRLGTMAEFAQDQGLSISESYTNKIENVGDLNIGLVYLFKEVDGVSLSITTSSLRLDIPMYWQGYLWTLNEVVSMEMKDREEEQQGRTASGLDALK